MSKEVMQQWLEALEYAEYRLDNLPAQKVRPALISLRQAIAETEKQEQGESVTHWSDCAMHSEPAYPAGECDCGGFNPVAWLVENDDGPRLYWTYKEPIGNEKWTPLFSTPQQRTWVGLTVEEIDNITAQKLKWQVLDLCLAIEAKFKEKNT